MNKTQIRIKQGDGIFNLEIPIPHIKYIENVARKSCFPEIWDLFSLAHSPFKEVSESYSALSQLRKVFNIDDRTLVIHVGDGAHSRTGYLFAFLTKCTNISIDPVINHDVIETIGIKNSVKHWFSWKNKIEDENLKERLKSFIQIFKPNKVLVTCVHAHVDSGLVIHFIENAGISVSGLYISACCHRNLQLISDEQARLMKFQIVENKEDFGILSPQRSIQVLMKVTI